MQAPPSRAAVGHGSEVASEGATQFLTFHVGEHEIGMDIASVREIIQFGTVTTVPLLPAFVRGVINLRGAVVPVIDLKCRLGQGNATVGKKTCIVIFDVLRDEEWIRLGMMVDSVSEVIDIPRHDIEAAPTFGTPLRRDFIQGMGKVGGRFVMLLEPARALDVDEMADLIDQTQAQSV